MDAELKFYRQNRLLLRFLVVASVVFVVIVTLNYLVGSAKNDKQISKTETGPFQYFSERASVSEVTYAYKNGAKYITDIESYPEIKQLFFSDQIPTYSDEQELKLALDEVSLATSTATTSSNAYVNSVSYYIGNLQILPGLALHNLLLEKERPYTTQLIETALADVRAGTVNLQDHFDKATPNFYDQSLKPAVYFPTPSFPSLTIAEVATVLYILAEVDKGHARFYEQQLKDYASQVFSSGSNFKVDIIYALKLAEIYNTIRQTIPEYNSLRGLAESEWKSTPEVMYRTNIRPAFNFKVPGFVYDTNEKFSSSENWDYKPSYPNEDLSGKIRLSLVDKRLTPEVSKLYEFNFSDNSLLPIAVDLRSKEFPILRSSVGGASYLNDHDYRFLTGELNSDLSWERGFIDTKTVERKNDEVKDLRNTIPAKSVITKAYFTQKDDEALLVENEPSYVENPITRIGRYIPANNSKSAFIDTFQGSSGSYLSSSSVIYVSLGGKVSVYDLDSGKRSIVKDIPQKGSESVKLQTQFFADQDILITLNEVIDYRNLIPQTEISFYQITVNEKGEYQAKVRYKTILNDAEISGVELSPAGRYLALSTTSGLGQTNAKVLIFDTVNGIIKKEIDLSAFDPSVLWLDEWVVLD